MTDGIRDALGMDSKNRENRDGETIIEASELRTLRQQLQQERERADRAEARCNHLTNECANLAQRNAQIERERDELREIVRELAVQEIHESDLKVSYVRTGLIEKARRTLGGDGWRIKPID